MNHQEQERDPRSHSIIGAAMAVHSELGPGFLEQVYQEALTVELEDRQVPFQAQVALPIVYRGRELRTTYRADFLCFEAIVAELKAVSALGRIEEAQILNYLKASRLKVGLLINFGGASLEFQRFVR